MDGDNLRPGQVASNFTHNSSMDGTDWQTSLSLCSRQRITNKIMETLKRHLPFHGPEGLLAVNKIAETFELKMYNTASSQTDYLRKISLKMLTLENKYQSGRGNNATPSNSAARDQNPPDLVTTAGETMTRSTLNCYSNRKRNSTAYTSLESSPCTKKKNVMEPLEQQEVAPKEPIFSCAICMDSLVEETSTICGHIFCEGCIKAAIAARKSCPTCRRKLTLKNIHRVYLPTTS